MVLSTYGFAQESNNLIAPETVVFGVVLEKKTEVDLETGNIFEISRVKIENIYYAKNQMARIIEVKTLGGFTDSAIQIVPHGVSLNVGQIGFYSLRKDENSNKFVAAGKNPFSKVGQVFTDGTKRLNNVLIAGIKQEFKREHGYREFDFDTYERLWAAESVFDTNDVLARNVLYCPHPRRTHNHEENNCVMRRSILIVFVTCLMISCGLRNKSAEKVKDPVRKDLSYFIHKCETSNKYALNYSVVDITEYTEMSLQEHGEKGIPFREVTLKFLKFDSLLFQMAEGRGDIFFDKKINPETYIGPATKRQDSILVYEMNYGWRECNCDVNEKSWGAECGHFSFVKRNDEYVLYNRRLIY
jgi:hypothetical protein